MKELSKDEKQILLSQWKESGKSAAMFCREKEIKPTTFYGWIKRGKKRDSGFVEIKKIKKPILKPELIVIEKGSLKINLPVSLIESHLEKVIKALS